MGLLSQQIVKDCGPCLVPLVCKEGCCPCFPLVVPAKFIKEHSPSKAWGTAYLPELAKMAVSQISN